MQYESETSAQWGWLAGARLVGGDFHSASDDFANR